MKKLTVICALLPNMIILSHAARAQDLDKDTSNNGPRFAVAAPNTRSLGRTKPSRGVISGSPELRGEHRSPEEIADEKITSSICIGCDR